MKNIIKKMSAFIVATLVIISLMPVTAKAEDTYMLYARVPSHWGVPNVWAWTDAGDNVFDTWPGQMMNATGGGEWYSIELPVSATNVIVNYKGDSNKTSDIKVNGSDVWITVCADNSVVIDYQKPTGPPPDSSVGSDGEMINLVAVLPDDWTYPYLWAWNDEGMTVYAKWPGEEMERQENGTVAKLIPDWVTGLKISANGGAITTGDILIDAGKDVFLTVYASDNVVVGYGSGEVETTAPDMPPTEGNVVTPPAQENTTPYVENTTPYTEYTTPYSDDMNGNNPTVAPNNNGNEKSGGGFIKFLIPAVCVIVIVVIIVATKKSSGTEE